MDTDTIDNDDSQVDDQEKNWKAMRESQEQLKKELADAKRKAAFLEAGVDTSTKAGQLLMKAYDGDLEADAIRQEASELGALKADVRPAQEDESDDRVDDADREMAAARQSLTAGAVSDEAPLDNVYETGAAEFERDLKNGDTNETALAKFISKVNYYGQSADPRMQQQVDVRGVTEKIHREARMRKGWE